MAPRAAALLLGLHRGLTVLLAFHGRLAGFIGGAVLSNSQELGATGL